MLALAAVGGAQSLAGEPPGGLPPGSYTAAQAESGRQVYAAHCAPCHGVGAGGGFGLGFTTYLFRAHWFGEPAARLFDFMRTNMPLNAEGSLTDAEYTAVIAYVMALNGMPSGGVPLPETRDGLAAVRLGEPPPPL